MHFSASTWPHGANPSLPSNGKILALEKGTIDWDSVATRLQKLSHYLWDCPGIWPKGLLSRPAWLHIPPVCRWPSVAWTNSGRLYGRNLLPSLPFVEGRKGDNEYYSETNQQKNPKLGKLPGDQRRVTSPKRLKQPMKLHVIMYGTSCTPFL
jgi:hypothetical protein